MKFSGNDVKTSNERQYKSREITLNLNAKILHLYQVQEQERRPKARSNSLVSMDTILTDIVFGNRN